MSTQKEIKPELSADPQGRLEALVRFCCDCGVRITACMGFVHAGDWLAGKNPVRELCGRCVLLRTRSKITWGGDTIELPLDEAEGFAEALEAEGEVFTWEEIDASPAPVPATTTIFEGEDMAPSDLYAWMDERR